MKKPEIIEKIGFSLAAAKVISNGILNGTIDLDTYISQDKKILECLDFLVKEEEYFLSMNVIEKIMDMMDRVINGNIQMTFSSEEVEKIMNNFFYLYIWLSEMLDELRKKDMAT